MLYHGIYVGSIVEITTGMEQSLLLSGLLFSCFAAFAWGVVILGRTLCNVVTLYMKYQQSTDLKAVEARVTELEDDVAKLQFKA